MVAKLTRLTHEVAIPLHLEAESCTICSYRSRRSVSLSFAYTLVLCATRIKFRILQFQLHESDKI
jgi:hypothetical protein